MESESMNRKSEAKPVSTESTSGSSGLETNRRWLKELEEMRRMYNTGKPGSTVEQILEEDRKDRV
jgi:hypothetical protein